MSGAADVLSAAPLGSGQEVLVIIVVQTGEVIFGAAVAAERRAVRQFLDVVQAAGDAAVAVGVEGVEVDAGAANDAGVQLGRIQNGLTVRIHHTRLGAAVGVDEPGARVSLIALAVLIAITQRSLDILQRGNELAAALQLALALLIGGLDGGCCCITWEP